MATRSIHIVMTHPDDVGIKTSFQIQQEQQEPANWYVYEVTSTPTGVGVGDTFIHNFGELNTGFPDGYGPASFCRTIDRYGANGTQADKITAAQNLAAANGGSYLGLFSAQTWYNQECTVIITTTTGGGGGGCHLPGTQISMADGTFKAVEDLQPGDQLVAASMPGLGLGEDDWHSWSANASSFAISDATTTVKAVRESKFYGYRRFNNGLLNITTEHPILVRRGSEVKFVRASEVLVGDSMFVDKNGVVRWEEITSHEIVAQPWGDSAEGIDLRGEPVVTVYELDCERHDVYFADGVLVHNVEVPDDPGDKISA